MIKDMPPLAMLENVCILSSVTVLVLGLYSMGAAYFSLVGFVPLLWMNGVKIGPSRGDDRE